MAAEVATNQQQNVTENAPAAPVENKQPAAENQNQATEEKTGAGGDTAAVAATTQPAIKAEENNTAGGDGDVKKDENHAAENANSTATVTKTEAPPKYNVHKSNFEKDIIYLFQFSRTPLLPSLSPYCLKVETWLRLAGLKYEVRKFFSEMKETETIGPPFFLPLLFAFCAQSSFSRDFFSFFLNSFD